MMNKKVFSLLASLLSFTIISAGMPLSSSAKEIGTVGREEWEGLTPSAATQRKGLAEETLRLYYNQGKDLLQKAEEDLLQVVKELFPKDQESHVLPTYLGLLFFKAKESAEDDDIIEGSNIRANDDLAFYWFRKGAKEGNAMAQYFLGFMHESGQGTHQNDGEAFHWYEKSALQDYAPAQRELAIHYEKAEKHKEAFDFYERAAAGGDMKAQHNLGILHLTGEGTTQNDEAAFHYLRLAAKQRNPASLFNVALMHELGRGTHQDDGEACYWFEQAAQEGYTKAHTRLFNMFVAEKCNPHNIKEVFSWLKGTVEQGDLKARILLSFMVSKNKRAAQQGDSMAQEIVRLLSEQGLLSKEEEDSEAQEILKFLNEKGLLNEYGFLSGQKKEETQRDNENQQTDL